MAARKVIATKPASTPAPQAFQVSSRGQSAAAKFAMPSGFCTRSDATSLPSNIFARFGVGGETAAA